MKQETQIINRYRVINKLGQGGMGAVWRVYDRLEQQEVALKQVLLPEKQLDFASKAGTDDTDKMRLSLAQEFSILATLRHPHILSVLDFGFDGEAHPFYTMTLLEGGQNVKSYATNISRGRRINLLGQMLRALHYLHRRGVLHRDLKPDNVFVTTDEQIKVMDFGLAKRDKAQSTQSDTISGTIAYMAPEQFQGESASVASDLFAVGVMAYEIMVGQHPFEAKTIGERIMKIMTHSPDFSPIPDNFVSWLETILAKDPSKRFATAYDAMITFYDAVGVERPPEDQTIRESFLQASEFVGRDAELKQLTAALETLATQNAFFLIGGESGVGKSRLLDEFRIQALVKGTAVLRGQGVEGGGLPFQLWRNIVRQMLLMVEVTDLQASVLKDIVPDVSEFLRRNIPDTPELTGKAYQERMVLNIVDLFRKLPQPVVLLLEDVQWTGESMAVLEQMLKVPEQLRQLMIVASYRDDETPDLPQKLTGMTHIKLERLTPDAVSELSSAMLGETGKNEEVVKLLHSQSEGNLFFLVETVRALAEASGDLQRIGQGKLPEGVFTGGMQAITRRRLSKVDVQYSAIQTLAAIIGREIDTKLLEHVYDEATVQAWLSNAADYGVVNIQDNRWRFAHDKLRETLIADIPDDTLPTLHRTAAETIEAVYPDDNDYNEALLTHWQTVGDLDKVYQYLLPVAKHMIEIRETYDAAQVLLHSKTKQLADDDPRHLVILNLLARTHRYRGQYSEGIQYSERAAKLAEQANNESELAISLHNRGEIARFQGDYLRGTALHQQGLAIRQKLGDQHGIAESLRSLGTIAELQGDGTDATQMYQQSLKIYQQLSNKRGIADCLNNLGIIADQQGDYAGATQLYQQSMEIYRQVGYQRGIASCLGNLGTMARAQGSYVNASQFLQQSLEIWRQLGDKRFFAISLYNIANVTLNQGEYERAKHFFEQGLSIFGELRDPYGQVYCLKSLGDVAMKQNDPQISSFYSEALGTAQNANLRSLVPLPLIGLAHVLLRRGKSQRSAKLGGLISQNLMQDSDLHEIFNDLIRELEAALPPDELAAALEHGKELDLDTVVQELLAEFGGDERDVSRHNPSDT